MIDDIPEATREGISIPQQPIKKSSNPLFLLIVIMILGTIVFGLNSFISQKPSNNSRQNNIQSKINDQKPPKEENEQVNSPPVEEETEASIPPTQSVPKSPVKDDLLGHLPYEEANSADLVTITSDGRIKLHQAAADKFIQMQADARADGINLAILSGFRDQASQNHLFFRVKEQRVQVAKKRAEVSAPPGYSEHHTGYALDFGDGKEPATHLEVEFEQTAAFKWLQKNAAKYSFELSFPRDNPQGISYEPWHWRFVGDRKSLEIFYKAKNK